MSESIERQTTVPKDVPHSVYYTSHSTSSTPPAQAKSSVTEAAKDIAFGSVSDLEILPWLILATTNPIP